MSEKLVDRVGPGGRRLLVAGAVAVMTGLSAASAPSLGPVHHWALNDLEATATDAGGAALDGQIIGATAGVDAVFGTGLDLDGADDYVSVVPRIRPDNEEYTFSIWGYGSGAMVSFKTPEYENYLGYAPSENRLYYHMGLYDTVSHLNVDTSALGDLSQSFHLFTLRGVVTGPTSHRVDVFIDGVLRGSKERDRTIPSWAFAELGRTVVEHNGYYDGVLDDFRIWSRALTDAEIASLFSGDDVSAGLTHRWALDEGSGTVADSAGGGLVLDGVNSGAMPEASGVVGTAYEFDGVNDFVSFTTPLRGDHEEYTFSIWGSGAGVLTSFKTPEYENYLGYAPSENRVFYHMGLYDNLSHLNVDTSALGDLSQDFHLFTLRGVVTGPSAHRVDVFIDGVLRGSKERDRTIPSWAFAELGRTVVEHNGYYDGVLDDFRIWNRALSDAEIAALAFLNEAPTANAGPDQSLHLLGGVHLDGTGSFDDNTPSASLVYAWTFTYRPPGSTAALDDAATATPSFTADAFGEYRLTLVVTDEEGLASAPDEVIVSSSNIAPDAAAGVDQVVHVGETTLLDGSGSTDGNDDPLTYSWSLSSAPAGSLVGLVGASSRTPSLTPDVEGSYTITLVVNDGFEDSSPDMVVVTAVGPEFAQDQLLDANDVIATISDDAFESAGHRNSLTNLVAQILNFVQKDQVALSQARLADLITRVDGWTLRGRADPKGGGQQYAADFVVDQIAQQEIYTLLTNALDALTEPE